MVGLRMVLTQPVAVVHIRSARRELAPRDLSQVVRPPRSERPPQTGPLQQQQRQTGRGGIGSSSSRKYGSSGSSSSRPPSSRPRARQQ
jgi:hypothetical protein